MFARTSGTRGRYRWLKEIVNNKTVPEQALLAASRVFARFLRDVWLDNLTPRREYVKTMNKPVRNRLLPAQQYSPQLFVPELFFEDARLVSAWRIHSSRFAWLY
jgi:hypothetical protein